MDPELSKMEKGNTGFLLSKDRDVKLASLRF